MGVSETAAYSELLPTKGMSKSTAPEPTGVGSSPEEAKAKVITYCTPLNELPLATPKSACRKTFWVVPPMTSDPIPGMTMFGVLDPADSAGDMAKAPWPLL